MHDKLTSSLAGTSTGAAAIGWLAQIDFYLHVAADLVAFTAGVLAIYSWWKSRKAQ